jgi:hypothetical protein
VRRRATHRDKGSSRSRLWVNFADGWHAGVPRLIVAAPNIERIDGRSAQIRPPGVLGKCVPLRVFFLPQAQRSPLIVFVNLVRQINHILRILTVGQRGVHSPDGRFGDFVGERGIEEVARFGSRSIPGRTCHDPRIPVQSNLSVGCETRLSFRLLPLGSRYQLRAAPPSEAPKRGTR